MIDACLWPLSGYMLNLRKGDTRLGDDSVETKRPFQIDSHHMISDYHGTHETRATRLHHGPPQSPQA